MLLVALFLPLAIMGCSSALLQCGVDGDSSFVTVNADNRLITEGGRNMAELCAFNRGAENAT